MRDIVFVIFFAIIFAISIRKPFISVAIWLWSGLFVPVYWLYGFAESIRYNLIFAATGIIVYLLYKDKPKVNVDFLFVFVILFLLHTTLTSATSLIGHGVAWIAWENLFKAILLFVFICLTIRKPNHFNLILWIIALSIGFFSSVEGLKFIASVGGHQIHGPGGHLLSDNNHMALAMLMTIPLFIYLLSATPEKWLRLGLIALITLTVLAVLGTKSRGGFIGLVIVGGYFWYKSHRKILTTLAIMVAVFIASNLLQDSWFNRMETIETAEEDSSFNSRVISWKIHTLMAIKRPFLGGGFRSTQYGVVWRSLAADFDKLRFIPSPPPSNKAWAAHSIYFQVLGDHGFFGLTIYLLIICLAFLRLSSIEKYFRNSWQARLSKMIKVSLMAYCVSGAAVSMAYFELFYVLLGLIFCLSALQSEARLQDHKARFTHVRESIA